MFLQYFFALSREGDLDFIAHSSIIQRYSALRPQSTAKLSLLVDMRFSFCGLALLAVVIVSGSADKYLIR